jgi:cobalt-zinc-cadmium efflux system outer membrane protein
MFNERTIELSQSFEFPTNYFLYGTSSSKSKNIASHENQLSTLNVRSKIKAAYYKLVWAIDQQQIEQENLALAEEFTNKAEIRLNVGEGTHLESLTAKVEYTEALNNLEKQKNLVLEANAELNYTLGNSQRVITVYKPTDSLNYEELGIDVQNLIDNSSTNNPEILISELSADKASVDKTLAWSGLLPSFRLAYAKQTLEGNNNYYGASFGISIPVWFLFEQRGKIQEASAQANISEYELEQTRSRVLVKIRKAYTQFTNEQKQVRLYRLNLLPQSEEIYSTAYKSYEAGEITYIEFLQAKQILTNTKSNYLQSLLNYNLAIIDLELAAGYELKEWSN